MNVPTHTGAMPLAAMKPQFLSKMSEYALKLLKLNPPLQQQCSQGAASLQQHYYQQQQQQAYALGGVCRLLLHRLGSDNFSLKQSTNQLVLICVSLKSPVIHQLCGWHAAWPEACKPACKYACAEALRGLARLHHCPLAAPPCLGPPAP